MSWRTSAAGDVGRSPRGVVHQTPPTTAEVHTLRQVRGIVRLAIGTMGVERAAAFAGCSPRTMHAILRGHNVHVRTIARILDAFGFRLVLTLEKTQHLAG